MRVYRKIEGQTRSNEEEFDSSKTTVPYVEYYGEPGFLMKKGEVRKDCPGIWQPDGPDSVFYSCPYCSGINKAVTVPKQYTQATCDANCLWCVRCERHLRLFYEK